MLETVAILGEIVPDCGTGTENTAFTLFGAKIVSGMGWKTCTWRHELGTATRKNVKRERTATEMEATSELDMEALSAR